MHWINSFGLGLSEEGGDRLVDSFRFWRLVCCWSSALSLLRPSSFIWEDVSKLPHIAEALSRSPAIGEEGRQVEQGRTGISHAVPI